MIKSSITPQDVVDLLNDMLAKDRLAVEALMGFHIACNKDLADHPTVQTAGSVIGVTSVGMLGLLNGLFGVFDEGKKVGHGIIVMTTDEPVSKILHFSVNVNA